jgi:hypothetical protein
MISLQRVRTAAFLPSGFRGSGRQTKERALLRAKRANTLKAYFDKAPWKSAKVRLRAEALDKCAYCESPTESQHGDVEHFRPKSTWWWLAVCYDNYLLSCQICNQTYKGDKFPLQAGGAARGEPAVQSTDSDAVLDALVDSFAPDPFSVLTNRTLASYLADCLAEQSLLIHPCQDKPEDFIIYEADATLRSVKVLPRHAADQPRIAACEECFGINREKLCEQRWLRYHVLERVRQIWIDADAALKPAIAGVLALELEANKAFAGMARYFVREVWKIPGN